MKVSIITATFNSASTIEKCLSSVNLQKYYDIEHIIVDGESKDNTLDIINSHPSRVKKIISEPDKGIYDALNKGIKIATGDIIGILNSDDFFSDDLVINNLVKAFEGDNIDAVFGDIKFVHPLNLDKTVRYYSSKRFNPAKFKYGFMPAHPSFYVKKEFFSTIGLYREDYKIAGDFELLIRFLYSNHLRYKYLNMDFVTMRTGGISTNNYKSSLILNREILRACTENGIKTNYLNIYSKYITKVFELLMNNQLTSKKIML